MNGSKVEMLQCSDKHESQGVLIMLTDKGDLRVHHVYLLLTNPKVARNK